MKKLSKRLIVFLMTVTLLCGISANSPVLASADDPGNYDYVITNMDVNIVANRDRSYDVTEIIDVYFNIASHGIYREIPTYSSVESYEIEQVNVVNDPFTYDGYGDIRIGDADKEITGAHRYTITYTLTHYADEEADADYFYMNLIGTEWDTLIQKAHCTVTLPELANIQNITLTDGSYGSSTNTLSSYTVQDNVITVTSDTLRPNRGITLNVAMNDGAFDLAKKYITPLTFHDVRAVLSLDEYGVLHVKETFTGIVNDENEARFSLYLNDYYDGVDRKVVEDIHYEDNHGNTEDTRNSLYLFFSDYENGDSITFTLEYAIHYLVTDKDSSLIIKQSLAPQDKRIFYENVSVELHAPFTVERFWVNNSEQFSTELNGKDAMMQSTASFGSNKELLVGIKISEASFLRLPSAYDKSLPFVSLILLAISVILAVFNRNEPVISSIEVYPPDDINPAEAGYLIDSKVTNKDVVSLIYYWASQHHLRIEMLDKKHFVMTKVSELDESAPGYERTMYNKLFALGTGDSVTDEDLKDNFYNHLANAAKAVKKKYSHSKAINVPARTALSIVLGITSMCVILIGLILAAFAYLPDPFLAVMVLVFLFFPCITILALASGIYKNRYRYQGTASNIVLPVLMLGCAAFTVYSIVRVCNNLILSNTAAILTALACVGCMLITPYIRRKTDYGIRILGKLLGFKQFLIHAEKERLEELLEENPEYYYDILPYANVLGVSKIWQDKFEDLLTVQPTWYSSSDSDISLFVAMNSLSNSLTHSLTSAPASSGSDGGGFSGGGGGGFSGGGFSGGGSGGGGGGRW